MNAHVGPAQTLKFRAQSLLAYVLEPVQPLEEWFSALDGWLARSPTFFIARPVILDMAALDITLKEYRDLLNGLARRHIRVMGAENVDRGLVGPHLPPVVSGGRPIDPPTLRDDAPTPQEEDAPALAIAQTAPEKAESLIVEGNVRSGQTIMHAQGDVTMGGGGGRAAGGGGASAASPRGRRSWRAGPFTFMERCRAG